MGQLPSANICEEYLHWLLLLEEEEGSLGLLPPQRLHALQVAGHQGAAVLWEVFCQKGLGKIFAKETILRRTHPSLSQASFLGLGEVFAVGCAGGGLDHGGLLEFKIIKFKENLFVFREI